MEQRPDESEMTINYHGEPPATATTYADCGVRREFQDEDYKPARYDF